MLSRWSVHALEAGRRCHVPSILEQHCPSVRVMISSSRFSSNSTGTSSGARINASAATRDSNFWNDPSFKGLDRSKKTEKVDSTFFGYKLEHEPLEKRSKPRSIPVRHSTHLFPGPLCPPSLLETASFEILNSDLGSLYAACSAGIYDDAEERYAIQILQDKFEVLLRGFSACLQGSYLNNLLLLTEQGRQQQQQHLDLEPLKEFAASSKFVLNNDLLKVQKHVEIMHQLLSRLEKEADMYWKDKHSKLSTTTTKVDNDKDTVNKEEMLSNDVNINFGAAPGPTTTMYDLVLDANAIYASCIPVDDDDANKIRAMNATRSLFQTILERHDADGGPANLNPCTIPTPRSFNAVIQTAATIQYNVSSKSSSSEVVRDEAIDLAFTTFDRMHRNDAVHRTWTTYDLLLELVKKFIPNSRSKGNVAYALFLHACDEGVVNESVWETLKSFGGGVGNGPDFERYLQDNADKTWNQLPHKWRKHANTPSYGSKSVRRSYNDGTLYHG